MVTWTFVFGPGWRIPLVVTGVGGGRGMGTLVELSNYACQLMSLRNYSNGSFASSTAVWQQYQRNNCGNQLVKGGVRLLCDVSMLCMMSKKIVRMIQMVAVPNQESLRFVLAV